MSRLPQFVEARAAEARAGGVCSVCARPYYWYGLSRYRSEMDFQQFQHSHGAQLANIPGHYWRALYEKLQFEVTIIYTLQFHRYQGENVDEVGYLATQLNRRY